MRLNPDKYVFGVTGGKCLGFLVDERGIEANPDKIQAIQDMKSPRSVKEVQKLTGCVAALGRFLQMLAFLQNPQTKEVRMDERSRRILPAVKGAPVLFAKISFAHQRGKAGLICLGLQILPIRSISR